MKPVAASASRKLNPLLLALYILWFFVAMAIAGFGAWVASTLAVFHDGPLWLALVGAFACFFLIPLGWELLADPDQKGGPLGRIRDAILRSSFLSLTFLVVICATHAETTFKALATRGDWWLAGSTTPAANAIRGGLHDLADGFEWLYHFARPRGYEPDPATTGISPKFQQRHPGEIARAPWDRPSDVPRGPRFPIAGTSLSWPLPAILHPVVANIPAEHTVSIEAVGKYLRSQIEDPYERVRAIHDFAADWLAYDVEKLNAIVRGDHNKLTTLEEVFKLRRGVCGDYAQLAKALGAATGDRIVYVTGQARNASDYKAATGLEDLPEDPFGHAWNAAEIDGRWHLFDATWDSGSVGADGFTKKYGTDYLFIPADVLSFSHLARSAEWQLRETPLSLSEWLRQPLIRPGFAAAGLTMRTPSSSPFLSVQASVTIAIGNPAGFEIGLALEESNAAAPICATGRAAVTDLTCLVAAPGRKTANIFARIDPYAPNTFRYIGSVIVDASH
jgi:hypothetical protein